MTYWVLMWRERRDWGWLCSLDGNRECTTQEPVRRMRWGSRAGAMAALWKFRRDNPKRDGEVVRVVRVTVVPVSHRGVIDVGEKGGG
jgi:hypothetical protein